MTANLDSNDTVAAPEEPPIRVMALHALLYCERLFYLEEVEGLYEADERVYAGRRLHEERVPKLDDDSRELRSFEVSSESLGLFGKVDAARIRDGDWVAYEHKKGRCKRVSSSDKTPMAWPSDRLQVAAYAMLLEEQLGQTVTQGRIRYHQDNVTVRVPIDDLIRAEVRAAVEMMRRLRRSGDRPPVSDNEKLCRRCSLRVICLPEEERITVQPEGARDRATLFPSRRDRRTLHVTTVPATVKRSARQLHVETDEGTKKIPMEQVDAVVLYGGAQITSQAIAACVHEKVAVQWVTTGGRVTGMVETPGRVRQRIRQYTALTQSDICLQLARVTVVAKIQFQLQYLLRGTRGNEIARAAAQADIEMIRRAVSRAEKSESLDSLRGEEGIAARHYFSSFNQLLSDRVAASLRMNGRTKHPPRDRLNCLLSYGYSMIFGLVQRTILAIGLEPAFGYFHQPRTTAPPLVMDVMELFRTLLWEMPLVGSLNRGQWDETSDFEIYPGHVWLSDEGRKKAITLFETRLTESYRHPYTDQSLEYGRMVELELRLLEKEWSGSSGAFGQLRIR
ncbi:CRISPR-associated protein Cas4/endonuclease Cas1 fusion [Novipirellula galeiformis]|uniref:CRISPR-associated endonuclease Cas1 n=1 Tax=Novipirellula galeiformis TaxID=2528004 RepID=A0A5C6CSV4_9BACT|nr:type I-MYXAN CRISPR-associated endonuclease Cas1 [Novipirellula galeiformis]TWU26511.1 CRISPR-associated protein Cas4/endonuclease Cas1 fusion [Novipirellula galeiformis]